MSPFSARPLLCSLILLLGVVNGNAFAVGQTTRVSVATDGAQGNGSTLYEPSLSADGRYVAFASYANNLVSGDTNSTGDTFVHDRLTKQTTRVSVATNGTQGNYLSGGPPSLSADGRYVAFYSVATNLVAEDTNFTGDIFVHDRPTKQTTRVSVATNGEQGNAWSYSPSLSADGRYVVFESSADNLVAGDTNGAFDSFVHDRLTKQTTRVSVATNGVQGNGYSGYNCLSADGRYVAFSSKATNLVAGDTNGAYDAFVHDRLTKETTRVSVATNGAQGNGKGSNLFTDISLSADGRYVAFYSDATNLVAGDTNFTGDIFVHDRLTKQTTRVSVATNGVQGNGHSSHLNISADGRYVALTSIASNLVAGDTNNSNDAFVHDRLTKQTTRVSVATNGAQANNSYDSYLPSLSADGRYVTFTSDNKLVAGDTNKKIDVFIRDRPLFTGNPTDLQIAVTAKSASLAVKGVGSYTFTVTNNGAFPIHPQVTHLISNGNARAIATTQGKCGHYASISLCKMDLLLPGNSMTLTVTAKAWRNPLHQQITVASAGRDDPVKTNNYLSVDTPVTP